MTGTYQPGAAISLASSMLTFEIKEHFDNSNMFIWSHFSNTVIYITNILQTKRGTVCLPNGENLYNQTWNVFTKRGTLFVPNGERCVRRFPTLWTHLEVNNLHYGHRFRYVHQNKVSTKITPL